MTKNKQWSSGRHDSITLRGSTWFDHKNQVGGGAIKFMQEFYDMDFQTAVHELLGQTITPLSYAPSKAVVHEEKTKEFKLPEAKARDCPGGARELFSWISTLVVGLSFSLPIKSRLRTAAVMSIDPNPR